ncbi:astacin-like [Clytia hemisphaerica]|uniref:Metalloendopeptidase n=1 Tax=Clytia hemisphaerica TaxID=252671 RepID=A0A7M5WK59_9CNID
MKLSCLLLMVTVACIHAIPKDFKWHDTVTLHHFKKSNEDFGDDGAHDLTHANLVDHAYDKSAKLPKGAHIGNGDILFRPGEEEKFFEEGSDILKRDAIRNENARWPKARVPYVISSANSQARAAITAAAKEFAAKTCIRLVPRTNERDYARIIAGGGCYSYVGRVGGSQDLSLGRGCEYKSTAIHEFMHALGFFHEQSRPDRDQFIRINFGNVQSGMESQFRKQTSSSVTTFNQPYDYVSVMHYEKYAFSKSYGRLATIVPKNNPNQKLGQDVNGGLSSIDAKQLNAMYCGGGPGKPTTTKKPTTGGGVTAARCKKRMNNCSRFMRECAALM